MFYNNDTIKPKNDSVYLVQAEYFIDTIPTPGKGKLIDLPHVDSIHYSDSIPGLTLDSGVHLVGVRVKDSKGAWSFIKNDSVRTEYENLEISVSAPPYIKQGEKTKYSITIKNNGSTDVFDVFLIVRPTKQTNPNFGENIDTINGVNVSNVSAITEFDSAQYIPIWIYTIPSRKEKVLDLYMETTQAIPHEILPQSFEIYYDFVDRLKPQFRINGDTSDFKNSRLFSILYKTIYFEQSKIPSFNIPDSIIIKKLDLNLKSIGGLFDKPIMFNKIVKPVINNGFQLDISNLFSDTLAINSFAFLRDSYFGDDDDSNEDSISQISFSQKTERVSCKNPCNLNCTSLPSPPLEPVEDFVITSTACVYRCKCICVGGFEQTVDEIHGGYDIAIKPTAPDDVKQVWNSLSGYDVKNIYPGTVIKVGWENSDHSIGFGFRVIIKTTCNGTSFETIYGHLKDYKLVDSGQYIAETGNVIGKAGTSGSSTGLHLHLEIRYLSGETCDPYSIFSTFNYKNASNSGESKCPPPVIIPCQTVVPHMCFKKNGSLVHIGHCEPTYIHASCTGPEFITPNDPNDKTGNIGYATLQYISKNEQLHYGVLFENKNSASAPAQVVTIKDTLDKNKIDVSSLKIESVTAGEMLVIIPDSLHIQNLDTVYTKQPINGTYVHVQTTFDTSSGILIFKMTSLDTLTLEPVTDPLQGFLPPDTTNFDGNGLVSFKVMPKQSIKDGTVIYNTAHIIFDGNPPIATGKWFNTIDNTAPSSYVRPLPVITYDTSFKVTWTGRDKGAGIIYYDIYSKKKNDTAYTKWLTATSDTSAIFTGQLDSTYEFYSIAYDSLLNKENTPDTADALTTISTNVLAVSLVSFNASCSNNIIQFNWVTANESGIKYFTIEKSMDGINWVSAEQSVNAKNNPVQNQYKISDIYNGYSYYRLSITDKDGSNSYSSVLKINCGKIVNSMQAYPVPARDLLNILIQSDKAVSINLLLTDMYGRTVKKLSINVRVGVNNFSMNINNLPNGQYILKAEGEISLNTQKIIISH